MCIDAHNSRQIVKNALLTNLVFWIYANYRNPTGYSQRASDIKPQVASYPSSSQIFGPVPIAALRINFRRENPVDLP